MFFFGLNSDPCGQNISLKMSKFPNRTRTDGRLTLLAVWSGEKWIEMRKGQVVRIEISLNKIKNLRNPSVNFGDCEWALLAEGLFNQLCVGVRRFDGWRRCAGRSAPSARSSRATSAVVRRWVAAVFVHWRHINRKGLRHLMDARRGRRINIPWTWAILSALFPSLGKRLSNRKSKSQSRLAAVEDSPLPSGGWTFSLLPTSLQEGEDEEEEEEDDGRRDAAGTPTESLGKRILFRPDQMQTKSLAVSQEWRSPLLPDECQSHDAQNTIKMK